MAPIPRVSVVVPTLNRADLLSRALKSILTQDVVDFEVIVVDDGSTDGTNDLLSAFPDDRVRSIRNPSPIGVSAARNLGTAAARGRWVAWCDDDDVWSPDKLRRQLDALRTTSRAGWSNGGSVIVDSILRIIGTHSCPPSADIGKLLLRTNLIAGGGSGVLADRDLVMSLGGFDSRLSIFADWHMWVRLGLAANIAVVDRPLVGYVDHPGGMSHDRRRMGDELTILRQELSQMCSDADVPDGIDESALAAWMLDQQVRANHGLDSVRLHIDLVARGVIRRPKLTMRLLSETLVPSRRRRRWEARGLSRIDPVYVEVAEPWLAAARDARE